MRIRDARSWGLAVALALLQTACLVLPVRTAPGVEGRVLDQVTGEPIANAVVVVRFDGRYRDGYGDVLPDRDHLGHAEATTDAQGHFRVKRFVRPGVTAWPLFRTEARVVGVLARGYRCPAPITVGETRHVRVSMTAALDDTDRRDSCRPVSARRGEAEVYMTAWRSLFPEPVTAEQRESERQIARVLEARSVLGFGENCEGPVHDLALAPGGQRVALVAGGSEASDVHMVELTPRGAGAPMRVASAERTPPRRLAWTSAGELVLWEPSSELDRAVSPSIFAPGRSEVVWRYFDSPPASIDRGTPASSRRTSPHQPLDPDDLSDEATWLWKGRSFDLDRSLDPETGLSHDRLRVRNEDGSSYAIDLPGEACGPRGRFGRPHYRIVAGGGLGLDLRYVDGGCHAVQIDLETGAWAAIDRVPEPAACRSVRRIPPSHLRRALRGWTQELDAALVGSGADPGAAYALRIASGEETLVYARDYSGEPMALTVSPFPIATPLERIEISTVAPPTGGPRLMPGTDLEGLEPL